ncbi:glycosyltransferase family 28 domain-containing [Fusarium albosuccineum]|uniref:Glycosyltransferase family 28 domain-containing n=1 Tax=Fusarium albosuccineum TaxID=1237068 RepID=A0A8H4L5W6_9HYPO|nr:glycosyltransferase family 28 domain-containing [Fusarium albosuccineum]
MALPFTVKILDKDLPKNEDDRCNSLLPASRRTKRDHIIAPQPTSDFLEKELLVKRLNAIQDWLWLCGRPMPPRPLHHQRLLSREIIISEDVELHLIWWEKRIFLKPLPPYLLDPDFWQTYIVGTADIDASMGHLDSCARGFLFSYMALISYESDFRIAKDCGLLPGAVTWTGWKTLSAQFLASHRYDRINARYWYGELRLSRLNKVYRLRKGRILRGYSRAASHTFYGDLLRDNFAILAGFLGYVVIALTAMQVGLGVERLQESEAFQNTSYGFTIFSLVAPLVGAVLIFLIVLAMFVSNWRATKSFEKRRFVEMGVGAQPLLT